LNYKLFLVENYTGDQSKGCSLDLQSQHCNIEKRVPMKKLVCSETVSYSVSTRLLLLLLLLQLAADLFDQCHVTECSAAQLRVSHFADR
jgi:hypothetical protein